MASALQHTTSGPRTGRRTRQHAVDGRLEHLQHAHQRGRRLARLAEVAVDEDALPAAAEGELLKLHVRADARPTRQPASESYATGRKRAVKPAARLRTWFHSSA